MHHDAMKTVIWFSFAQIRNILYFFVIENHPFLIYCFKQPFANSGFGSTHGLTSNTVTHTSTKPCSTGV